VLEFNDGERKLPLGGKKLHLWKYMAAVLLLVAAMSAQNAPSTNKGHHLDIPTISREADGAIVSIVMSDKDGHPIAQGSGFLISKDGHVVTNYHVIKNGSSALVKLPNGTFFAVDGVLASDKSRDVVIIKVHGIDFRRLTLGDSDRLQVGEEVVAIGNPLSLESTVSNGIVSAIRIIEDEGGKFVQITAPISPGSSGGPLFNMSGEVVGITTSGLRGGENLNFAIPINDVKLMLKATFSTVSALPDEPSQKTRQYLRNSNPDLKATLNWLSNSSDAYGHYTNSAVGIWSQSFVIRATSCDMQINGVIISEGLDQQVRTTEYTYQVNLHDLDPTTVRVYQTVGNFYRIDTHTTNDVHRITFDGKPSDDSRLAFRVEDAGYAIRFGKAFKRAVVLCGGHSRPHKPHRQSSREERTVEKAVGQP
jgi:S1-C subfamily serine protease